MEDYQHYIELNAAGVVTRGFSTAFESAKDGDICVNERGGRHFNPELINENGQYVYKYIDGEVVERTSEELAAELAALPVTPNPDVELASAIQAATTLAELKSALLGNGKLAKVQGKMK